MKKLITISLLSIILSLPVLILSPQKKRSTSALSDYNELQVSQTIYHY